MAVCSSCGNKIGLLTHHHKFDSQILCQLCYEKKIAEKRRQELEYKKRLEAENNKLEAEKKKIAIERRKRKIQRKKKLAKKRELELMYGKLQDLEKWKGKGLSELIRILGDKSPKRRAKAAYVLGEMNNRQAVRPLIETLKDRDIHVTAAAASALGKIGDPRALDDLRKISNKKNIAPLVYKRCIDSIDKLKKIKFDRMAKIVDVNIKKMSWQDFEDVVCEALDAVPSDKRTSDGGIDGITKSGIPIQIKQSERIGRNVIDNFETALRRYYPSKKRNIKGIIVAFSFTKGAYDEAERAKREDNININLKIAEELIS